jgi:phosphatidate cytidylyltransferase
MTLEHKKRIVTAIVGVIALFAIYFTFGHWGLIFLTVITATAAYYEFVVFSGAGAHLRWVYTAAGFALSAWLSLELPGPMVALYLASALVMLCGLWRAHSGDASMLATKFLHAQSRAFGLLYLIVTLSFVPRIHSLPHGPAALLFLFLVIWMGDIAAYYGGKKLGRTKLSKNISPGKTLEGSGVALVACAALAAAFHMRALDHLPVWKLVLIAVLTSVVAQAGDLIESMMKRSYQVKDSGTLLPGHGGVFDRFDSLILAAPFYYFLLQILG